MKQQRSREGKPLAPGHGELNRLSFTKHEYPYERQLLSTWRSKLAPQLFSILLELVCCPRAWVLHLEFPIMGPSLPPDLPGVLSKSQCLLVVNRPFPNACTMCRGTKQPVPSTNVPMVVYFSIHMLGNLQQSGSSCFSHFPCVSKLVTRKNIHFLGPCNSLSSWRFLLG